MSQKSKPIDLYYDSGSGSYWLRTLDRYARLSEQEVRKHLMYLQAELPEGVGALSAFDTLMVRTQRERSVDYAGPLAGYPVGPMQTPDGGTVLVTSAAKMPLPDREAGPGWIGNVFAQLIPEPEPLKRFLLWCRHAYVSARDHTFAPGQMLCLFGPANCGKSFAQVAIAELLGGRSAKAFDWMMGRSGFNGELAGAETWVIDDDDAQTDAKSRRSFGNSVKRSTVSTSLRIRKMHSEAVSLTTFRRIILCGNDESENLSIMPVMDESIQDKVMMFHCSQVDLLSEDRLENMRLLRKSLPGFVAHLLALRVPVALKDRRCGVKAYHDPHLLSILGDLSPETRLANLIDEVVFAKDAKGNQCELWTGPAEQLEKMLRHSSFGFAVEKLLSFSSACGVYLARLAARHPDRFACTTVKGRKRWKISAPAESE